MGLMCVQSATMVDGLRCAVIEQPWLLAVSVGAVDFLGLSQGLIEERR